MVDTGAGEAQVGGALAEGRNTSGAAAASAAVATVADAAPVVPMSDDEFGHELCRRLDRVVAAHAGKITGMLLAPAVETLESSSTD